jgi:hypothetical protein
VTAARQVHGLATSRAIEGFGDGCTPVNNHRLTLFIRNGKTPNVETFEFVIFEAIDTTKHQGSIAKIKISQALHQGIVNGIALKAILKGPAHSGFGMTAQF